MYVYVCLSDCFYFWCFDFLFLPVRFLFLPVRFLHNNVFVPTCSLFV